MAFSFGQPSTSGGGGSSLFGTAGNTAGNAAGGNLFGGNTNTTGQGSGSLFGATTPASSGAGLFGGAKPATSGGPVFGGAGNAGATSSGTTPSLFGGNNQGATTTPSSNKTTNLFQSTTPMGAPASGQQATGLFGTASTSANKPSLFGAPAQQQTSSATGTPSLFSPAGTQAKSGSIFGATAGQSTPGSLFSQAGGQAQSVDASKPASTGSSGTSLFAPKPNPTISVNPPASSLSTDAATTATTGSETTSLFSKLGQNNSNDPQYPKLPQPNTATTGASPFGQQAAGATTASPFQFTKPGSGQQPATSQTAATTTGSTAFSLGGAQQSSAAQTAPTSAASSPFGNLPGGSKSSAAQPTTTAPANPMFPSKPLSSPSATSATTATSKPTLFGPSATAPTTTTTASGPSFQTTAPGAGDSAPAATTTDATKKDTTLGASTAGPKPTPQSRLKNKSMDEIITRWASDLQKYQKEFQAQAQKVADWDRKLVTSSEQIQKLYGNTLEAERATTEVERQLTAVENDQSEIEFWLENYEKQVDDLLANQSGAGGVPGEALQGPDADRERAFKTAERLNDRLTEMGKDLGSMVEEINDATKTLSTGAKADDPLSQIVRVLNGHLSQLQQIDQGTAQLQKKVTEAQNQSRNYGASSSLIGSSAADDFMRSYMGRR